MSYQEAKGKYEWTPMLESWARGITRMQDFDMLDFEIGEIEEKPTAEQVERILDEFNDAIAGADEIYLAKLAIMRDAIAEVMGREYLDR